MASINALIIDAAEKYLNETGSAGITVAAIQTSAFTPALDTRYPIDTSGGAIALTALPSSPNQGDTFELHDPLRVWDATNSVTVPGAAGINGRSENQILTLAGARVIFEYVNANYGWEMKVIEPKGQFAYSSPFISPPSITSPSESATVSRQPTITTSAFEAVNSSDTHLHTDWQIATDSAFTTIVAQSLDDTSNKVSWAVPLVSRLTAGVYYVRARHSGTALGDSDWSPTVSFTAAGYTYTNAEAGGFESAATEAGWDDALRGDIDQLFSDLKSGQVNATNTLTKLDFLFLHDLPNSDDARLDIKSATLTATAVNSPTHTATEGFTFDGSTSYLNTGWNPSTDASHYALNGGGVGAWARGVIASTGGCLIGAQKTGASAAFTQLFMGSGKLSFAGLQGSSVTGLLDTASVASGLYYIERTGASAIQAFVNNSSQVTGTQASTNLVPLDFYIGARNTDGVASGFAAAQVSLTFACADLTANERADLYDALNRYRTAREAAL